MTLALAARASAGVEDPPPGLIPTSTSLAKVRALFVRSHERERGRNATIIEEWRVAQDKMTGTFQVFRLGKDERDVTLLGPLLYESGVRNGVHWQQTRNGMTYTGTGIHEARDAQSERAFLAELDPHFVHLIGESVALNAYVVEIDPPAGRREWRFIDKRTGNLTRRDYVQKQRRYSVTYDDYRIFDGIPEPSRIRLTDSYGNDRDLSLLSRTLDLTPDARDVDIPPSRRTLVEFPAGISNVRLPMRVVNGLCVVKVHIAGRDYDFLLDSGAAGIVVDPAVIEDAHIETLGTRVGATIGTFSESTAIVPLMTVGALRMHAVVTRVVSVPFHLDDRTRIMGLLGFDFFLDTVVHVDLDHAVANVIAPGVFHVPADVTTIPLALDDRTPVVRARTDAVGGRVVIDTGANRSLFTPAFASRVDVAFDPATAVAQFRGMGGTGTAETVHLKSFELAGLSLSDPVVDVSNANLGAEDIDGTAGTDLLHAYDLFFDYHTTMLYVRRSRKINIAQDPCTYDPSSAACRARLATSGNTGTPAAAKPAPTAQPKVPALHAKGRL